MECRLLDVLFQPVGLPSRAAMQIVNRDVKPHALLLLESKSNVIACAQT